MIAGNKSDLATSHREIVLEDVSEWLYCELPKMRAKVFECSAKDDHNVSLLFKTLLSLSRILPVGNSATEVAVGGLKRRSSAYVSATSKGKLFAPYIHLYTQHICICTTNPLRFDAGKGRMNSPSLSTEKSKPDLLAEANAGEAKLKPRSRSLIRRSSRKTKQQIQNTNAEDCNVQ